MKRSARGEDETTAIEVNASGTSKKSKKSGASSDDNVSPWYRIFTKGDEEYDEYMSKEWSFEKRGDVPLFEKLCLEGAQSGLSWRTILRKRSAYHRVFCGFEIDAVASMTSRDVDRILASASENPGDLVVRHRGKIEAVINNAKCVQQIRDERTARGVKIRHGAFDEFLWSFVDDRPVLNRWDGNLSSAATKSPESEAMSRALKSRGFKFIGPTTCYAMMVCAHQSCDLAILLDRKEVTVDF